ncbi:MAG: cadmium resistance protein CadD (predicted permease) [Halieaceae bacterium]
MLIDSSDLLAISLVTVVSFIFTNLDNLILAVVVLGSRPDQPLPVQLGMVSAAVLILLVSLLALAIGRTIDVGVLGYLGLAPIGIGLYTLFYSGRMVPVAGDEAASAKSGSSWAIWLSTTTLLLSNSGDSLALLLPLLVESNADSVMVVAVVFIGCAVVWAVLAKLLSRQPLLMRKLQDRGERLVPWIMIGVGIYILLDTGTDSFL